MKRTGNILAAAALAAACALLFFPAAAAQGARNGLDYSLGVLVPSLYPFLVLAVFVVKSGVSEKIGRVLEKPTRALFHLPGSAASSVLLGAFGGYPAGARSAAALWEEGAVTPEQAERIMTFCVNAGPSFVVTAVGVGFLRSARAGGILFASQLTAFLAMGLLSGIGSRREKESPERRKERPRRRPAQAFVESASDAAYSTMMMCCMVILFAAMTELLRLAVKDGDAFAALSALLEVTGGCAALARRGAPLWTIAFALGWGGVCVHFQIFACVGKMKIRVGRFLLCRLAQGILAAAACAVYSLFFPRAAEAFSTFEGPAVGIFSGSVFSAAALLLLCAALLFSLPHGRLERGRER